MIGVSKALVRGRLVVQPNAFQFQDTVASFGQSQLYTPLVSIGFDNALDIVIDNKGGLDYPTSAQSRRFQCRVERDLASA